MVPVRDEQLIQIVDAALVDATVRAQREDGTSWLSCRPGCTPCCHGVFRISLLDAERLRDALRALEREDAPRAAAIRERARLLVELLGPVFPGNGESGLLDAEEGSSWETFADLPEADGTCPVLNPATGRCELYDGRPLTCRVFGPPVKNEAGIGMCELCYVGSSEAEMLAGEMILTHEELENELDGEFGVGETLIAWAVRSER